MDEETDNHIYLDDENLSYTKPLQNDNTLSFRCNEDQSRIEGDNNVFKSYQESELESRLGQLENQLETKSSLLVNF